MKMNLNQAKNFLKKLNADGLMYHLEDCAVDCLHETNNIITKKQAREIQKTVDSIYESDLDWGEFGCPIGYCLHLMKL